MKLPLLAGTAHGSCVKRLPGITESIRSPQSPVGGLRRRTRLSGHSSCLFADGTGRVSLISEQQQPTGAGQRLNQRLRTTPVNSRRHCPPSQCDGLRVACGRRHSRVRVTCNTGESESHATWTSQSQTHGAVQSITSRVQGRVRVTRLNRVII